MILKEQLKQHMKNKNPGAGVVIYRNFGDINKILVLLKPSGKFDIPKGRSDYNDVDKFTTAQRECFEETNIFFTRADLISNLSYSDGRLTVFCAATDQDPVLGVNPVTDIAEHVAYFWMDPFVAIEILPKYLANAVRWSLDQCR
jgi:8-oxo-dGTP pyrophosphatase MutT (NUDIX family)